jgi:4-alpha-glucanotransferase
MVDRTAKGARRVAGVTVPLFSLRGARSWGIGEIADLVPFAQWMAESAGIRLVQILPLGEISGTETSPYSAMSAFGIDWLYLSLDQVPELDPAALREALGGDMGVAILRRARESARVDYEAVRFAKKRALEWAFLRFEREHLSRSSDRARAFEAWSADERHWLEDYALFRAIKDVRAGEPWWKWERPLRDREPWALDGARQEFSTAIAYYKYLQWLAHGQWETARAALHEQGLEVMGDLPFMVGRDSADVWGNQKEFRHDRNVGAPGDQFDPEGQDWGLPPYKWEAMRANDFAWLRRRARYAGSLYDRFRIDHLIGFYRTYTRPLEPRDARGKLVEGVFDPLEPRAQLAHGERVVSAMKTAGLERSATLIAEDLGVIPDWVRASLTRLDVPGYKVLIWEKDAQGEFRDPTYFPARSVSALGTHDTDSCVTWWETREEKERLAFAKLPIVRDRAAALTAQFGPAVHKALLDAILTAGSELCLLLIQDVLAVRDRVNTPGTVGPANWTWRLPAPPQSMRATPAFAASIARVREAVRASGREG